MNKNQDQELEQEKGKNSFCNPLHQPLLQEPKDAEAGKNSDARLSQIFGEALGDEPSKEETLAAWEAFEKKHLSSEEETLQKAEDELSEKKIEDEIEDGIGGESSSGKVSKARILTWITASVAVAASLFLFIFRSSQEISQPTEFSMELFSEVTSPKQVEQTLSDGYCVVSTPAATTTLVTLSDGTKVMLNANSTLEYPASFDDAASDKENDAADESHQVREVRLKGEAHFEVTKNPHRPFVVKAGEMQTQVLGTVFDVKAYRKDAPKVTLMQGKVKVSNADTEVEMRPGQTATLQSDKIVVSKASPSASDWLEGDFDMDQVTLAEAMSDIGAWYNKTVVFQSQANMDKLIHFRFSRRASLQEIITALNEMGVAKVRIEKGKIMVL
nr:FecR family protein [Prevotella sp.]